MVTGNELQSDSFSEAAIYTSRDPYHAPSCGEGGEGWEGRGRYTNLTQTVCTYTVHNDTMLSGGNRVTSHGVMVTLSLLRLPTRLVEHAAESQTRRDAYIMILIDSYLFASIYRRPNGFSEMIV